jgi:hypothetical protein
VEDNAVLKGGSPLILPTDVTEVSKGADPKCQVTQLLEGNMSEILWAKDAINVMTSVLLIAVKIRIQANKFSFEMRLIGTTTNTANIRKYTEQSLMDPPFEVATKRIAKSGAGYASIGLQKA